MSVILCHKLDHIIFVSFFDNFSILVTLFWLSLLSSHLFTRKSHFSFVRISTHWPTYVNVYTTTKIPAHSSKTAFTHDSGSSSACWALLCWNWSDKLLLLTRQQVSLAREQSAPPPLTVCTVLLPSCGAQRQRQRRPLAATAAVVVVVVVHIVLV